MAERPCSSGSVSNIVSGLNFVLSQARSSGRPTVASMSLGGGVSTALDNAVASLTSAGIHVTVAGYREGQRSEQLARPCTKRDHGWRHDGELPWFLWQMS